MTIIERLNLSYYSSDVERQAAILAAIDEILANAYCPACGEMTDAGTCWSIYCSEGLENVQAEVGDMAYRGRMDRDAECAYELAHDL